MKHYKQAWIPASVAAAILLFLAPILSGCSDAAGPTANNGNPPGSSATVEISDPVTPAEAASVRSNTRATSKDSLVVSIDDAIATALTQYPGAQLLGINLDYDNDTLNYECVVRQGEKTYLIVISPRTGVVKSKGECSNAYYTTVIVVRTIKVKVKEAKEKAKEITGGGDTDVVECNVENIDDRPTYVIIIIDRQNRYITVYVDSETGRERKIKDDGKCKNKEHKNKRGRGHYRHGNGHGYGHHHHCKCECEDGKGGGDDSVKVPKGVISVDSAKSIAKGMVDSSQVVYASIKVTNDTTASYNVTLKRDSNTYDLRLNAFTGALERIEQTAGNFDSSQYQPTVPNETLVSLSTARTAALAQRAGNVTGWYLEYDKTSAKWIYTFSIQATGTTEVKDVEVDAKTGTFIRIK
jgi:uncharacterized membrane protein YkoI